MKYFAHSKRPDSLVEWMTEDCSPATSRPVLPWLADEGGSHSGSSLSHSYESLIDNTPLARLISGETFFDRLARAGSLSSGLLWKFISLVPVPLLYATASYLFFAKFLGWWEFFSRSGALLIFILVCAQVNSRLLRKRLSLTDVLKFMVEEVEVIWLMWMVGSLTYTYLHHHVGLFSAPSYVLAIIPVVLSYLLAASHVRSRPAAETILPYLLQFGSVVVTSVVVIVASFLATPLWWNRAVWPYDYYIGAIPFSLFWFWVAINLFYEASLENGSTESLERGSTIELS